MINSYIKIARFDNWIKQLFIIPGILIAIFLVNGVKFNINFFICVILGFFGTSFTASANYIINEYLDSDFDKYHPTKRKRPFVTRKMNKNIIFIEYFTFAILGLICSFFISTPFFITDLVFLIMGIIYNVKPFRTKDIAFLDTLSESINNALRLMLGWFIVTDEFFPPIGIVVGYWMFGAFLMGMKRYSEYLMFNNKKQASLYRKSFTVYNDKMLLVSSIFYALVSIFLCGVFMIKYKIELLLCIPFLCMLYCYYIYISFNENSVVQKPEKLYTEYKLILLIIIFCVLFFILLFINIPFLNKLVDSNLVRT